MNTGLTNTNTTKTSASSNKVRIAHIADCHLRATQYGSRGRGTMFSEGLMNACRTVVEAGIKYILCSGDILDSTNPSASVLVYGLKPVHEYLRENGVTMLVIKGNHDNIAPHWCEVFEDRKDYGIKMPLDCTICNIEGVSVLPIHYCTNDMFPMERIAAKNPDIVMWHGEIKEFLGYPKEDAISINDFPKEWSGLCALGDQHITKKITRTHPYAPATFVYPGSTELCTRSEDPQKYVIEYVFESGENKENHGLVEIIRHPFKTQHVIQVELTTEEMLDKFVTDYANTKDAVIFVQFDASIPSAAAKLQAVDGEKTTLNLIPCLDKEIMSTVEEFDRDTLKKGPSSFFLQNKENFLTKNEMEELTPLVADILNPDRNMQVAVSQFIENQTGKIII